MSNFLETKCSLFKELFSHSVVIRDKYVSSKHLSFRTKVLHEQCSYIEELFIHKTSFVHDMANHTFPKELYQEVIYYE